MQITDKNATILTPAQERHLYLFPDATAHELEMAERRQVLWNFRFTYAPLDNTQRLKEYRAARAVLEHCVREAYSETVPAIVRNDPRTVARLGLKLQRDGLITLDSEAEGSFLRPRVAVPLKLAS